MSGEDWKFARITVNDAVSEWEMRGCDQCDPDKHLRKYGNVDGLRVVHSLLHDRQAAVDCCNRMAARWDQSRSRGLERQRRAADGGPVGTGNPTPPRADD